MSLIRPCNRLPKSLKRKVLLNKASPKNTAKFQCFNGNVPVRIIREFFNVVNGPDGQFVQEITARELVVVEGAVDQLQAASLARTQHGGSRVE